MRAWHNDPDLKRDALDRMNAARIENRFIRTVYQEPVDDNPGVYRGCLIGMLFPPDTDGFGHWHQLTQDTYGIPAPVAHLLDAAYELVPFGHTKHADFAVDAVEAIPVGADLTRVIAAVAYDLITEAPYGFAADPDLSADAKTAVEDLGALYRRWLTGDHPSAAQWRTVAAALRANNLSGPALALSTVYTDEDERCRTYSPAHPGHLLDLTVAGDARSAWVNDRIVYHLANAPVPTHGDQP